MIIKLGFKWVALMLTISERLKRHANGLNVTLGMKQFYKENGYIA